MAHWGNLPKLRTSDRTIEGMNHNLTLCSALRQHEIDGMMTLLKYSSTAGAHSADDKWKCNMTLIDDCNTYCVKYFWLLLYPKPAKLPVQYLSKTRISLKLIIMPLLNCAIKWSWRQCCRCTTSITTTHRFLNSYLWRHRWRVTGLLIISYEDVYSACSTTAIITKCQALL